MSKIGTKGIEMYLDGTPSKEGLYWLKNPDGVSRINRFHDGHWKDIESGELSSPLEGYQYWDLMVSPPNDYSMGGSYSCYARDVDQRLEEIHED
jgi:hypothetical protein